MQFSAKGPVLMRCGDAAVRPRGALWPAACHCCARAFKGVGLRVEASWGGKTQVCGRVMSCGPHAALHTDARTGCGPSFAACVLSLTLPRVMLRGHMLLRDMVVLLRGMSTKQAHVTADLLGPGWSRGTMMVPWDLDGHVGTQWSRWDVLGPRRSG